MIEYGILKNGKERKNHESSKSINIIQNCTDSSYYSDLLISI